MLAKIITAVLISIAVCFILMPFVIKFAKGLNIVDKHEKRHQFGGVKLRLGGIAVAFSFFYTIWLLLPQNRLITTLFIGGLFIVLTGAFDDIKDLKPYLKLVFIIVAAIVPIFFDIKLEWINIFGKVIHFGQWSIPITILWIVVLTNAMNLIDGLDGLAGGIAVISSFTILLAAVILNQIDIAIIAACLCGACAGFLPFNINLFKKSASITLGDTGALFIGYTFAVISIDGLFKFSTVVSYLIPAVLFSLPIFDVLISVIRRKRQGKSIVQGDKEHLHYKVATKLGAPKAVLVLLSLTTVNSIGAVFIALGMTLQGIISVAITAVAVCVLYYRTTPKKRKSKKKDL